MSAAIEVKVDKKIAKMTQAAAELSVMPTFIQERIEMFDKLMADHKAEIANKPRFPIKIFTGWEPGRCQWRAVGFGSPIGRDSSLSILKFDNDEAKQVFWHSSAHVLGEACERYCGSHLCYGPPIADGFYYDMYKEDLTISQDDFPKLQKIAESVVKDKQVFERLEMKKEDLLKMFAYNKFKVRILEEKVTTPTTTVYRCGPLIDLCRGPHVRDTGKIKAMAITKASSSYWQGNANAESLQRVYGISFPDSKQLKEWQKLQEEAAKRDHRKIGKDQELWFFDVMSPGSAFWYPKGTHIYNTLVEFIRKQYRSRGFKEIITPNMYNSKLWQKSGHWEHYAENIFEVEKEQFGLKPMNCPGHCLLFDSKVRTYNELPLRFADFGVLHRNEMSGALTGLTRVRRFQQDDAHIFCRQNQIGEEIRACLDFLNHCYVNVFGFTFKLYLSTRPEEGYLGSLDTWESAEAQLKGALDACGHPWELNAGDGAFYGPKIDISIQDALKRFHQCGTIQLDFQLPMRFDLKYYDENQKQHAPVMIHRAVLGSIERMTAILAENFAGKWPFWLSPRQLMIITVHKAVEEYANFVHARLFDAGFEVEFDEDSSDTLNKRICKAQLAQFNFILVVGQAEKDNGTVNVRTRDNQVRGEITVDDLIAKLKRFRDDCTKDTENAEEFSA
uniref:threonine--tRNA ligase n=1 Tax=Ditylenchus dipsaci TaxID=166011 RepID=A0A915DBY0_9BILA